MMEQKGSTIDLTLLRRYWHPVARAEDIQDGPLAIELLGEAIVLFRSGDNIRAFTDLCVHRGAKLSLGKVKDGMIICPYHGFTYDANGACVYIPSQPRDAQKIPRRVRLTPYRTTLRYGLVWLALQDPVIPIPEFPQFGNSSYHSFFGFRQNWRVSAARFVENVLDFSHFPVVHAGLLGDPEHPEIEPYEITETDTGFRYEFDWIHADSPHLGKTVHYQYFLDFPFTVRLLVHGNEGLSIIFFAGMPIDENKCGIWVLYARDPFMKRKDTEWIEYTRMILAQDQQVTESQRPEMLPVDLTREIHLRVADAPGIVYRRLLEKAGLQYA